MDTRTGQLYTEEEMKSFFGDVPTVPASEIMRVMRDLTALEKSTMQIRMYAPCCCGSGKKFKFCCYKPPMP